MVYTQQRTNTKESSSLLLDYRVSRRNQGSDVTAARRSGICAESLRDTYALDV
jgi:hypothetical protein